MTTSRRSFLQHTALAATALTLGGCASLGRRKPLFDISLAEWSLNKALFGKKLDHLDFPKTARQDYGIGAIELVNQFMMKQAKDQSYLAEFKKRADGEGVRILLIMCDNEGALGDPDEGKRLQAVENHYKWAEAARYFGCHSIRVNAYSKGTPDEQRELAGVPDIRYWFIDENGQRNVTFIVSGQDTATVSNVAAELATLLSAATTLTDRSVQVPALPTASTG